jgi:hypothetical protein
MKKRRLEVEYSYDFELLGISSSAKGFKLAWDINQLLSIRLVKGKDLIIEQKAGPPASYACFEFESALSKLRLFRNKSNENDNSKVFLVPEFPHMDYILMGQGEEYTAHNRLQELLRNIPSVELVAFLPLAALKSKDNFIF